MAYENVKFDLMLAWAGTAAERVAATRAAVAEGMPIHEIEEYFDWLDTLKSNDAFDYCRIGDYLSSEMGPLVHGAGTRKSSRFHLAHPAKWWHILTAKVASFLGTG
jgi:hypothetical protein